MSQAKLAHDEMTMRLAMIYELIILYGQFAKEQGNMRGFDEDELSLIRWAFGITKN